MTVDAGAALNHELALVDERLCGGRRACQIEAPIQRSLASAPEGPLREMICAENPNSFFPGTDALPVPQAAAPDF
jgi:hypothetical protein